MPAGTGVELLGVKTKWRGDLRKPRHQVTCALRLADDGQGRYEPERADDERALVPGQPIIGLVGAVAQDESVLGQLVGDGQHGCVQPLVGRRQKPEDCGQ